MIYKYIHFDLADVKPKTKVWVCISNSRPIRLGIIEWYGPWRQYCFIPEKDTVFNKGCMLDIIDFIEKQMKDRS